ncbi:cell division protein FtsK [Mycobacterium sp. M1]|uniref:Cell division protein FtsK n=1 Tax=Mycolicibacter acidiphilus TaxID=2835306 RepID=A0ABS5RNV0_9MYCO|nr:cell division protein FtsK [Mycolicibacter acidiphilus]MBS9535983.1 cell division protein FtsK [Mycolicibacter acidiphilus]
MTKQGFIQRSATGPTVPESVIDMPNPGELVRAPQSRPPMWVWMLIFAVAAVSLMVILFRSGARQMGTGSLFIMPVMVMSMLMMARNRGGGDKNRPPVVRQTRADYLRKLDELRDEVHASARAQATEVSYHHPNPADGALMSLVNTARMWERSPRDRNFGHVRIGVGLSRLRARLQPPQQVPPPEARETVTTVAARDFLLAQNVVHDIPRPLHLFDQMGWALFAEPNQRELVQGILRALICQLCVFHSPESVRVAIVSDDTAAWEWAKWLPHVADRELVDASGPVRLIFSEVADLMTRMGEGLSRRAPWAPRMEGTEMPETWLVVVVDLPGGTAAPILGVGGHSGVSVLEATGDEHSALATPATAFVVDEMGNLLRASEVR